MGIVPMHEWKVPLKYRGTLSFPSGYLGYHGVAHTTPRLSSDIVVSGMVQVNVGQKVTFLTPP